MAKEYIYTNIKSGKVLFRSIEPNYVSKETVDLKVKEKTGQDPVSNALLLSVRFELLLKFKFQQLVATIKIRECHNAITNGSVSSRSLGNLWKG